MILIDGKKVANEVKEELKRYFIEHDIKRSLAVIQIGNNETSNIYINQKRKIAEEIGINFLHFKFEENETEESVINKINELNSDKEISGIMIQLPLPQSFNEKRLINFINYKKDVDGLTDINRIKLINKEDCFIPCTPLGIVFLLNYYNINVSGKHVVIVGRSNLVSKPLFNLLLNMDATITMCHSKTKNLIDFTSKADILISATGKSNLIKKEMLKENAVVVDVGISRINNKITGDVDFENAKDKASYITPVPGGVGPMTVIMLMKNVVNKK